MSIGALLPAVIGGGLSLFGASKSASAAKSASKTQAAAANRATRATLKMYRQTRKDLQPYTQAGLPAVNSILGMYGLKPGSTPFNEKSLEAFRASPDYQVALKEGLSAVENSAAARGQLKSGATLKGITDYAGDLATKKFDNYMSRLYSLAGMGQNAAARTGSAAMTTGSQLGNLALANGEALASGQVAQGNIWGDALSNLGSNLAYYLERNPSAYSTASIY